MDQGNATQTFLGNQWSRARVELYDVQPLWGGRNIFVAHSVTVQRVLRGGREERRYLFEIGAEQHIHIIDLIIGNDFLTISPANRPGIPDEAHPTITLVNAAGEKVVVAKWAGVKDARFDSIYAAITHLESHISDL